MKTIEFATKKALNSRTPLWAKNAFRITFVITSVISIYVGGTQMISESIKIEIMLILKVVDALVLGVSKLFGVTEEK